MLNLDTHILIEILIGQIDKKEEKILKSDDWCISDIVLWELYMLNKLGRIKIDLEDRDFKKFLSEITIFPIDSKVIKSLQALDFKSDPADEIISAVSISHKIPLVTRDAKIKKSKIVPLVKGF